MAKTDTKSTQPDAATLQRAVRRKNKQIKRLYIVMAVLFVLLLGGAIFAGLQYKSLKDENARLSNPEESAKVETQKLKEEVAKLVDIPMDEEPTIASVVDASKLQDQPFFAKAENGDRVLMFANAKKAVLYRPSTGKVIEFAPITTNETQATEKAETKSKSAKPNATQQPGVESTP